MDSTFEGFSTPWLSHEAREPVFRLVVQDGQLHHHGTSPNRPIGRTDVELTANTLKFNGRTTRLTYALADWPELALAGELTLQVRLRGTQPGLEQFIAGRFGQNYLTSSKGWPVGNVSPRPDCQISVNSRGYCQPDRFYDVVLRFRSAPEGGVHEVSVELHDVAAGSLVARSRSLPRHFDNMLLQGDVQPFTLGGGGDYALFAGEIAAVTVWDCLLPMVDLPMSAGSLVATSSISASGGRHLGDAEARTKVRPYHSPRDSASDVSGQFLRPDLHNPNASRRWHAWLAARKTFPIAAWGYFHRFKSDVEDYRVYREANLTMVMAPLGSVDAAEAADLDPVIGLWEDNGNYAELYRHPPRLDDYIEVATKRLTRCAGYMLADEPRFNGPDVDELAPGFETIYARDARALPMVNMMCYPYHMGGGFEHYLEQFIRGSRPAFLVSDVYVLYREGRSNDPLFYANIEVVRRKALEAGIGFMGFVLNTGHNRPWPENALRTASESDLHWQVNTLLAYGAQGLWYYNYRIRGENFDAALVDEDGHPTRNYAYARRLNAGVLANGPLLQRLVSIDVWHCRPAPDNRTEFTRPYVDGVVRGILRLQGDGLVIAEFAERESSAETQSPVYVMFVNQRHAEDAAVDDPALQTAVTLTLEPGWSAEMCDSQTGECAQAEPVNGMLTLSLGGGARALLRLSPAGP